MGNVAVYKKGTTDFFSQGLGLLSDVVSSTLTQTVSSTGNVEQKLEVEYPIDGYLVSELVEGAILRVSVSTDKSDYGVFEIVDTLKDDSGTITVYGDPYYNRILRMSFDNGGVFTKFSNVQSALNVAKQNITGFPADFNLTSNLSTSVDLSENTYDTFGTFLEALNSAVHGNIKYSLNSIQIYSAIGKDITDITLRDDMNTSSVKITTDFSGIINRVIPVLPVLDKDGNATDQTKVGTIVTSKYSNQFLDYWAGKVIQFDTQDLANTYFDRTNADRPVHTVDVNPIGLDDDFSTINIFDTIELYSTRLDYTDKLRVSERVFDTLSEDVTSFKLGSSSVNIFNQINEQNNEIFNNVVKLTNAAILANGKGIDYFGQAKPSSPKEGDTWFWDDGTDFGIKQYTNGEWVDLAGSNTAEKIATAVDDAVTQANAYSDQLVADNVAQINTVLDDVQAKQSDLTAQQAELDTKAQGYANKALADAKADTLATAAQTAKDASDALAKAKTDLTANLNKEVTDRANAVTALDTKAKGYADTAKADAISVGATADGVINKKIDDTASSITSTISQNKTDADGKITTAQSTATQALNGLATKVSQTAYDAKTGQLQTDLNTTTTTANQAKTDIVAIKSDKTKQDARMTTIESDANGTKTTVSNLQTDLGKANGSITSLQQRADGFDATVTKVNNLSVGGRNLVLNSGKPRTGVGTNTANNSNDIFKYTLANGLTAGAVLTKFGENAPLSVSFDWSITGSVVSGTFQVLWNDAPWGMGQPTITVDSTKMSGHCSFTTKVNRAWAGKPANALWIRMDNLQGTLTLTNFKFEQGNLPTDWSPAPEDVDSATAKAQLTADKASLDLSKYQTDADGRISKAQADIIVNANAITQKVSQSDYNAKTGDLTTKVNTAQSTADSATSTIGAYKTSNDARVASAESKITANATAITQKVSQTDYNTKTGQIDGQISTINQTASGISQSVSNVKAQVDGLSVGGTNLFVLATASKGWLDLSYNVTAPGDASLASDFIPVTANTTYVAQQWYIMSHPKGGGYLRYAFYDSTKTPINRVPAPASNSATYSKWIITTPANTAFIRMSFDYTANNGSKVKFEQGNLPTDWSPAPEDTDNKISTVSQTVSDITSIVSDPTTGLTKRVQTAEGSISTVQSNVSDLQSKQTQTANGLTTEISNRQTGDTNTLTQAKDFTTSSITSSETGMRSQITQTSDSILAKVDTKTDSSTVLSLLKDNWSIGIADNAGAITSGIVGNSSNMSLISNNVVINAPSTQIKGTAWINSAMIGNGAIGTAQIGDASITSAKIMNLDVNKITGNVSNWVLSQWTSATGNKVTIDGNGLYFSPGTSRMTADGFEAWRRESAGNYAAMGMLGSYAWETDQDINGVGLIAKYYGVPHNDPNDPYRNETWGGDTIAIGALEPEIGRGYNYVTPYMIFPSSSGIGEKYFQGNGNDTIVMSRWLSIYTGLNMRGHSIVNSSGYSLKENFSPVSGADALDIFDNTEIMTYDYKPDSDDIDARTLANMQDKVGFVINDNGESPFKTDPRLVRYGNTRDDSVTVGYLMSAVKELHTKVKELETQLGK